MNVMPALIIRQFISWMCSSLSESQIELIRQEVLPILSIQSESFLPLFNTELHGIRNRNTVDPAA
jgi:hypothetical protein